MDVHTPKPTSGGQRARFEDRSSLLTGVYDQTQVTRLPWQVSGQALSTAELSHWPNCSSGLHTNNISLII